MGTYPIMLNMKGKDAVVVGGGQIAYRKMISLIQAGACVTVISPVIQSGIQKLLADNNVIWKSKAFEPVDLESALLVIAATNSKKVNEWVALSAGNHQLINVVDDQELSNFHVPAKLTRGDLTISVATGGASPTLAKVIRDELAVIYDESYANYVEFLAIAREQVNLSIVDQETKVQLLADITNETYRQSMMKREAFLEILESFR